MKNKLSQAVAASIVAVGLLFAAPAAAQAYTPSPIITVVSDAGYTVSGNTYTFSGFSSEATVSFTLTGENAAAGALAYARLAVTTLPRTKTADSSGSVSVTVTLPEGATGTYILTASGSIATAASGGGSTLPSTGGDSDSLLGIWIGGGALVLAGATIAVGASVRRGRQQADA